MSKPRCTDYILQTTSEGEDKKTTLFKRTRVKGGILAHNPVAELWSYKKPLWDLQCLHRDVMISFLSVSIWKIFPTELATWYFIYLQSHGKLSQHADKLNEGSRKPLLEELPSGHAKENLSFYLQPKCVPSLLLIQRTIKTQSNSKLLQNCRGKRFNYLIYFCWGLVLRY